MQRIWIITNPASGSTSPGRCGEIAALLEARGAAIAGQTDFPREPLPTVEMLDASAVDTVAVFGGDGTINAALSALANWPGAILILPGGTMNLLAHALHGDRDLAGIIAAADVCRRTALPFAGAGTRRAYAGLILGPAAHWARAREAVRLGRFRRLLAASRNAWRQTFSPGIRVRDVDGLDARYQAVLVRPEASGLVLGAIDARDWRSIATLGWRWLTGDWMAAQAVSTVAVDHFTIAGGRPVLALFDGEPVLLDPGVTISAAVTGARFIATAAAGDTYTAACASFARPNASRDLSRSQ